jgi:cyclic pyranopterin monophosphate synthase
MGSSGNEVKAKVSVLQGFKDPGDGYGKYEVRNDQVYQLLVLETLKLETLKLAPCKISLPMPRKLSHYDRSGKARMVDVSEKSATRREAEASAFVVLKPKVLKALPKNPKGDPLEVARLAGIMAAKQTSNLIPMCHPLALAHVDVNMRLCENGVAITSKVTTIASTGVEMEALVAASVAALTVYDMCKALDKGIEIREILLERKSGGKSGDYSRARRKA